LARPRALKARGEAAELRLVSRGPSHAKTGYKIFDRYEAHGLEALTDRSRRPVRYANQLPSQVESLIVSLKRNKPHWGARNIRELLLRRLPGDLRLPAKSTIHAVLDRHGLVKRMGKRRSRATGTPLSKALAPNDLWCADFKGEFKLGNGRFCYPLTVTDQASRFDLRCEAVDTTREEVAVTAFERLFADRGLPDIEYLCHDRDVLVAACGLTCIYRKKINISTVLAGQRLGIKELDDGIWLVSFIDYDLGYFDDETCRLEPLPNPFQKNVLPMSQE
jgi:transposase InsO family protein